MTGRTLDDLDLDRLVGLTTDEAEALVHRYGGRLRSAPPGGAFTADFRPNRVSVTCDGGRVVAVHGIG